MTLSRLPLLAATLCLLWFSSSSANAQRPDPGAPLPPTNERVADIFGDEVRLYFDLPDNYLVFVDGVSGVRNFVPFGLNERNDMMTAYLKACGRAGSVKDGERDEGFSIAMGYHQLTFKAARKAGRSWVVLYVLSSAGEKTRFAIPQGWDLKDPKVKELYGIKSGFEHLVIKAGL